MVIINYTHKKKERKRKKKHTLFYLTRSYLIWLTKDLFPHRWSPPTPEHPMGLGGQFLVFPILATQARHISSKRKYPQSLVENIL